MSLPKQSDNFPEWYNRVVLEADMAENSQVRGCMVIKPYGYAIWEKIQKHLDEMIKDMGVDNVYFPLLIPESFLQKEAKHVAGFSPEVAVVTHAGGKELEEKYVIRPTSETVINDTFSRWIKSYRDLPLKINQWANIMRWEMRPRLFLRTSEFLWQEGHTAHTTLAEAAKQMRQALDMYGKFAKDYLAIYTISGLKSELERFAGADTTTTIEGLMRDGKALQMGTSHNLGQNFAKAFAIKFLDKDNQEKYPYQTSWGVSTRLIGALIMAHGDDKGLILPPKIAPLQVIIVPIYKSKDELDKISQSIHPIVKQLKLAGIRYKVDLNPDNTPGWKFNHWELKGVPLRVEIGPKEIDNETFILVDRLKGTKQSIPCDKKKMPGVGQMIQYKLDEFHKLLYERSSKFTKDNTKKITSFKELSEAMKKNELGFFQTGWCETKECEIKIQNTKATIRLIPFTSKKATCVVCGQLGKEVLIAKAY